jgi:hypothetical protein
LKKYTKEILEAMTPEQRSVLYQNAAKHLEGGGQEIIDLIDSSGLSLSSGHMRASDPAYLAIEKIVWSAEGRKAALEATEKGLPALAGVEGLIVGQLGNQYGPHDGGTLNAGYIQAGLMRHLGYVEDGQGKMPEGCIAKTAMKWKPRSR